MVTQQLNKTKTRTWLGYHQAEAVFDVVQRRGGYQIRATVERPTTDVPFKSIWLDHFKTPSAADTALKMYEGNLNN